MTGLDGARVAPATYDELPPRPAPLTTRTPRSPASPT